MMQYLICPPVVPPGSNSSRSKAMRLISVIRPPDGIRHLFLSAAFVLVCSSVPAKAFGAEILVSIKPLGFIVRALADSSDKVEVLVPDGASPHTYHLKPSDLRKLADADLVVWTGPNLESGLTKPVRRAKSVLSLEKAFGNKRSTKKSNKRSDNILTREDTHQSGEEHGDRDEHDEHTEHKEHADHADPDEHSEHQEHDDHAAPDEHTEDKEHDDHADPDEHSEHKEHGDRDEHDEHTEHKEHDDHAAPDEHSEDKEHDEHADSDEHKADTGTPKNKESGAAHSHAGDPHFWLSPTLTSVAAGEITQALIRLNPQKQEVYIQKLRKFRRDLTLLKTEITAKLRPVKTRGFVSMHDAYSHFAKEFDLNYVGYVVVSPESGYSASHLARLRSKLTAGQVVCILREPQISPQALAGLRRGLRIREGVWDPLGADTAMNERGYFAFLSSFAEDLKNCIL